MTCWILFKNSYRLATTQTEEGWKFDYIDGNRWISESEGDLIQSAREIHDFYGTYAVKHQFPILTSFDRQSLLDFYELNKHNFKEGFSLYQVRFLSHGSPTATESNLDEIPF